MAQRAIDIAGPLPDLLDTQGMILLRAGDTSQAISRFEAALAERPSPEGYVHLALAQHSSGMDRAARESLQQARTLGLSVTRLHPSDRRLLVAFEKQAVH